MLCTYGTVFFYFSILFIIYYICYLLNPAAVWTVPFQHTRPFTPCLSAFYLSFCACCQCLWFFSPFFCLAHPLTISPEYFVMLFSITIFQKSNWSNNIAHALHIYRIWPARPSPLTPWSTQAHPPRNTPRQCLFFLFTAHITTHLTPIFNQTLSTEYCPLSTDTPLLSFHLPVLPTTVRNQPCLPVAWEST